MIEVRITGAHIKSGRFLMKDWFHRYSAPISFPFNEHEDEDLERVSLPVKQNLGKMSKLATGKSTS